MKVRAKVSFSGIVSMGLGAVQEIDNEEVLRDLLEAGYVEEVKEPTENADKPEKAKRSKKAVAANEDQ